MLPPNEKVGRWWALAWSVGVLFAVGCQREDVHKLEGAPQAVPKPAAVAQLPLQPVALDARPGAGSPRLTAGPSGAVLSWLEPEGDGLRLRARAWGEDGPTQTVVAGVDLLQNWADVPSVMPSAAGWVAAWPQLLGEHGYNLQWSRQTEDGSWTPPGPVSDAEQGPEFGFISWAPDASGGLSAFWLDGRGSTTSHGGAMQLWTATVSQAGVTDRRVLDERVCDCCQTAATATPRGPVVVYRDRDENEVRDIWVAGPGPQQRRRVGVADWRIEGCPVNGPSIAASGDTLAVAWFSGAANPGHVRVAFATGELSFSSPVVVDDGDALGRVDLVWVDETSVAVVWLERTEDVAEVRIRRVDVTGSVSAPQRVASTEASRPAGFPHLERVGTELALTWVDLSTGAPTVAAASSPSSSLPACTQRRMD